MKGEGRGRMRGREQMVKKERSDVRETREKKKRRSEWWILERDKCKDSIEYFTPLCNYFF